MTVALPRDSLLAAAGEAARGPAALALTGPLGSGKSALLAQLARALQAAGWRTVSLDLMGAASSPERFVRAAVRALPEDLDHASRARAEEVRALAASGGRPRSADAVQAVFSLWAGLDESGGRPVALLLDEPTEIRSLAYFPGLREVHAPFGAALAARRRGTIVATSFPTLARRLWPALGTIPLAPLTADDLRPALRALGLRVDADALARVSFGSVGAARVLLEGLAGGADLATTWTAEMSPGGRLDAGCRYAYEVLLLRSRGYGMSKAVLATVAEDEGLNLKALVDRLGRTPGAIRDYLGWLLAVDALAVVGRRYYYADGLLRLWVRVHARGFRATPADVEAAFGEAVASTAPAPVAAAPPAPAPAPGPPRNPLVIEID